MQKRRWFFVVALIATFLMLFLPIWMGWEHSPVRPVDGAKSDKPHISPWNPESETEWMDRALAALHVATLLYEAPKEMVLGETKRVTVAIGRQSMADAEHGAGLEHGEGIVIGRVPTRMSPRMKVFLKGADFDITPLASEEQYVSEEHPTQWAWDISAKRSGDLFLRLTTFVEVGKSSTDFLSQDIKIQVDVSPEKAIKRVIYDNLEKILGALAVALLATIAYFARRHIERNDGKRDG